MSKDYLKYILLAFVCFWLAGCKANVETTVSLSDLLESDTKIINGDLYLSVASCDSYEDSRKPSDAVVEAKKTVPAVFEGAKYVECFTKQFDSFAHFSLPIMLDKDRDNEMASEKHINILANEDVLLGVAIPDMIRQRIEKVEQDSYGMTSFDLDVNIHVKNDLGKAFDFSVISAFVDSNPYVFEHITSKGDGGTFTVTLSDVSVEAAMQTQFASVLFHKDD